MKKLALIATTLIMMSTAALADGTPWPNLKPGEVKVLDKGEPVPDIVRQASGFAAPADMPKGVKITLFKAAHGSEYVIISPCCGPQGAGASFFAHVGDILRPEALALGNPLKGFTTQPFADAISVYEGAKALRAQIDHEDCEEGTWGYYYQFDEIDQPQLASVIDTGCAHLGIRELYHSAAKLGHWWQQH